MDSNAAGRRWLIVVLASTALLLAVAAAAAVASLLTAQQIAPVADGSSPPGGRTGVLPLSHAFADEENKMEAKVDLDEMRDKLTPEQYNVCFNAATEPAFCGAYWDHHEPGAYHCVACDTPLFSSQHKFDSGTGWPSFFEAVEQGVIETRSDRSHGMVRTETLCSNCGAHLGHLFEDGPAPTGLRYCINSAALEFVADGDAETPATAD